MHKLTSRPAESGLIKRGAYYPRLKGGDENGEGVLHNETVDTDFHLRSVVKRLNFRLFCEL